MANLPSIRLKRKLKLKFFPKLIITSQSGVAHVLLLIFLIAGVGLGTVLIQQRTDFLPSASDDDEEDDDGGYEGDRASEPDHGETNVESENAETEQRDSGGGGDDTTASDGQSLDSQSDETKEAFKAAYGENAEEAWKAEHEKELETGKTADGRDIVDGKPVDPAKEEKEYQSEVSKSLQNAQQAREAAQKDYDAAKEVGDTEAAIAAFNNLAAAQKDVEKYEQELQEAALATGKASTSFDQAVDGALTDSVTIDQVGKVVGGMATEHGASPQEAARKAAEAAAARGGTSENISGAAAAAALAAGASPEEAMKAAANATSGGEDTSALDAAISVGNNPDLGLSSEQIAEAAAKIAESKGYSAEQLGQSLSAVPGLTQEQIESAKADYAARQESLAKAATKVTEPARAEPAPGPAPVPVKPVEPPLRDPLPTKPDSAQPVATNYEVTSKNNGTSGPVPDGTVSQEGFEVKSGETGVHQANVSVFTNKQGEAETATVQISKWNGDEDLDPFNVDPKEVTDSSGKIDPEKVEKVVNSKLSGSR